MGNSDTEVAINNQPQRREDNNPIMEEVNTHAQSEMEGGRTLNGTQKSWEESQQPKLWVKPTAYRNHGLN